METLNIVVPAVVTITNTSDREIRFIPYRENFSVPVAAGDVVKLEATTAGQVFYYLAQETDGLTVEQEAKA